MSNPLEDVRVIMLVEATRKMMLCFPVVIEEGSIDMDFDLPALIVQGVRDALDEFPQVTEGDPE